MGYVEKNMMAGEKIVFQTKLNVPHLLGLPLLLCIAGISLLIQGSGAGAMFLTFAILIGFSQMINYMASEFAVTNKRIILKVGLIRRTTVELLLSKIEGLNLDQGLTDRILGSGTISVTGTGGKPAVFKKIDKPDLLRKHVNEQIEAKTSPAAIPTAA